VELYYDTIIIWLYMMFENRSVGGYIFLHLNPVE